MSEESCSARPSVLHLPQGPWATVLDCLCARFPAIAREVWQARMRRGRVLDGEGRSLAESHPYQVGLRVQYFREVPNEPPIPFQEDILYADEQLVIADKPHFLPVQPTGAYVQETLLARLCKRLNNPHLAPLHRIDRLTAGLVMFSANPATRGAYQALFRQRRIEKCYEAICPALPELSFPHWRRSRLVSAEPFFLMREAAGEPNSETRIEVLERRGALWRYALFPISGRKHQLRVHMAALGAGICYDPLYPTLWERARRDAVDYRWPLKLLARQLAFIDPLNGYRWHFTSNQRLSWPDDYGILKSS